MKFFVLRILVLAAIFAFLIFRFHAFLVINPGDLFQFKVSDKTKPQLSFIPNNVVSCTPKSLKSKSRLSLDFLEEIFPNDNRKPAGSIRNGVLYIELEARTGMWYPETHDGSGIRVHAFAEKGKPLQLPGPLIRVPEGTEVRATIHNIIGGLPLVLHGFYSRPGSLEDSIVIPYGQRYEVKFKSGSAGTYFYGATTSQLKDEGLPYFDDSQLYGALIIDPFGKEPDPEERIIMIGVWDDTLNRGTTGNEEMVMNGLSWPYTERLTYLLDEKVNWRVINASAHSHPMHLHGFFFSVNSKGTATEDTIYKKQYRRLAVTELLRPGATMSMAWTPEREGNWLFHCHTLLHIMPWSFLRNIPAMDDQHMNLSSHPIDGMAGLIMGIHVRPSVKESKKTPATSAQRNLTLVVQEQASRLDTFSRKAFSLYEGEGTNLSKQSSIPGPPIILTRHETISIKIINKLREPTSIHWHGLEIESYFDGVAGWGNRGKELTPLIMPGDSFVVYMTPPRAGTFIYHTHMHNGQLLAGMYGPLLVVEPGDKYNAETNKIFLISEGGDFNSSTVLLNGSGKPKAMQLNAGIKYRLRLINIMALSGNYKVSFVSNKKAVHWRAISKDGAALPPQQQLMIPAAAQPMTIGETRDFEFQPMERGKYSFEVYSGSGNLRVAQIVQVK